MMFSPQWNELYRANRHMSIWPWSDLVSYVYRFANPADGFHRVLELGCGAGANIPFFIKIGADYFSIDGSPTIVTKVRETYAQMKDQIVVGDFTKAIPLEGSFDLVIDRAALTHNTTVAIRNALKLVFERLRTGGKFIGIDYFADDHQDAASGDAVDSCTRKNILSGPMTGAGAVHFSNRAHLVELLSGAGFAIESLEHKLNTVVIPDGGDRFAAWNFSAVKP